jgi:hypothetical protein
VSQALSGKSDSVAPAGLGYIAFIWFPELLWKKKARLIGRARLSHSTSVKFNPGRKWTSRGISLKRPSNTDWKRSAHESQVQTIRAVAISSMCRCSPASPTLQSSHRSIAARGRAKRRKVANTVSCSFISQVETRIGLPPSQAAMFSTVSP